jgi:hypothetical protein
MKQVGHHYAQEWKVIQRDNKGSCVLHVKINVQINVETKERVNACFLNNLALLPHYIFNMAQLRSLILLIFYFVKLSEKRFITF